MTSSLQKNRRRRNRKKKSKSTHAQEKKEQGEGKGEGNEKDEEPEVEIEYVTEEPDIYDSGYIIFKRIFEAFKVSPCDCLASNEVFRDVFFFFFF